MTNAHAEYAAAVRNFEATAYSGAPIEDIELASARLTAARDGLHGSITGEVPS